MRRAVLFVGLSLAVPAAAAPPAGLDFPSAVPRSVAVPLHVSVLADDAETAARALVGQTGDLVVTQARTSLAGEHVRFGVLASDGTRVAGGEISVHMTRDGRRWQGRLIRTNVARPVVVDGSRSLSRASVERAAVAAGGGGRIAWIEQAALPGGPGAARAGWRALVVPEKPRHEWEVWIDGETGATRIARDGVFHVDGTGWVYRSNPMTTSGDLTLIDNNDADSATLTSLREMVVIQGLDGSGMLLGDYVDAEGNMGRVNEPMLVYDYTRNADEFEEVMAYYTIDHAQRNLQALGFTGGSAILAFPFHIIANDLAADNSFYSSAQTEIQLGRGGVDDGEDGDVITHEYGHAVQDDIVPGWGTAFEANAWGEGFGDILAASTPTGAAAMISRACVAPWDATSYSSDTPPCLRRVDGVEHYPEHVHGQIHDDGEIVSGAVWDMYEATGLGPDLGLALVVEAHFSLGTDATFLDIANAIVAADVSLNGGVNVPTIRRTFLWHGVFADITPPAPFTGASSSMPITVESAHPIGDNEDHVQVVTVPGATALRLHFASFDMEVHSSCVDTFCDAVYLYDANGLLYARLGGPLGAFDAVAVPGESVTVRWVSDSSIGSMGFLIDSVAYLTDPLPVFDAGPPPPDADPAAPDADPSAPDADTTAPDADTTAPDAGVDNKGDASGCSCRATGARGPGPGAWLLALAAVILVRRRFRT